MRNTKVDVSKTIDAYKKSDFDPNGSYTGVCENDKSPTQDADDL